MKFWDSSAIIPLITKETESESCALILQKDPLMMVWALAPIEILSALYRKNREGFLSPQDIQNSRFRLRGYENAWIEVSQLDLVRRRAERVLSVHSLRAADGIQLAAALVGFEEQVEGISLVTFDRQLAQAAYREGFAIEGISL